MEESLGILMVLKNKFYIKCNYITIMTKIIATQSMLSELDQPVKIEDLQRTIDQLQSIPKEIEKNIRKIEKNIANNLYQKKKVNGELSSAKEQVSCDIENVLNKVYVLDLYFFQLSKISQKDICTICKKAWEELSTFNCRINTLLENKL